MLVSSLIEWCNALFQNETSDFDDFLVEDDRWMLYFNEGISQCRDYAIIEVEALTDIVSGTSKYALPSDCVDFDRLFNTEDGVYYNKLNHRSVNNDLGMYDYFIFNNEINIDEPTASVTDGLKLYYYKDHDAITATDQELEYNDDYVLGYYALSRVAMAYGDKDKYEMYYAEFLQRRDDLDSREVMPSTDIEEGW